MILEKLLAIDPLIGMRNAAYVSSCPGKINFPVQISAVAQTGLRFQHFEFALEVTDKPQPMGYESHSRRGQLRLRTNKHGPELRVSL
jgi:hypothetical protein